MRAVLVSLLVALIPASRVAATTIHVPDEQPTIQTGIDASSTGDTVLVACGTYYEHDIEMKSGIVLHGESGEARGVVIDAMQQGRVMRAYNSTYDSMSASIRSVTFRNGLANSGAGIYCGSSFGLGFDLELTACAFEANRGEGMFITDGSTVTLVDCSFTKNEGTGLCCEDNIIHWVTLTDCTFVDNGGGGVSSSSTNLKATDCVFRGNRATLGGSIVFWDYNTYGALLSGCTFERNSAVHGGAIYAELGGCATFEVSDCFFGDNVAERGGAISAGGCGRATISGSTFADNSSPNGSSIYLLEGRITIENSIFASGLQDTALRCEDDAYAYFVLHCSDIYGNAGGDWVGCIADQAGINGNMSVDPQFCLGLNPTSPYALQSDSPCAEANNPGCGQIGAFPVGCEGTAVGVSSMSAIKALY